MKTSLMIRTKFIEYFVKHHHKLVDASPLIQTNNTTMFTIAGMQQFTGIDTKY
jgi:alanyl-tRNA synthetase